jgi:hypothetical protein
MADGKGANQTPEQEKDAGINMFEVVPPIPYNKFGLPPNFLKAKLPGWMCYSQQKAPNV